MALPQTAIKIVIENKKVISWDSEPPTYGMGQAIIFRPVIQPPLFACYSMAAASVFSSRYSSKSPG